MGKKEFPKLHFYDHDLTDMYDYTFNRLKGFWKRGTSENDLQPKYFSYPEAESINQFEAILATFFLVYSNRVFPVLSLLDNFYNKQEADGAIRGESGIKDGISITKSDSRRGYEKTCPFWSGTLPGWKRYAGRKTACMPFLYPRP